jgi:hypothetical protein
MLSCPASEAMLHRLSIFKFSRQYSESSFFI